MTIFVQTAVTYQVLFLGFVLFMYQVFYTNMSRTSAVSSTNFGSVDYSSLQAALLVLVIYYVVLFV